MKIQLVGFVIVASMLFILTHNLATRGEDKGLVFRLVHPENDRLPSCNSPSSEVDLAGHECFTGFKKRFSAERGEELVEEAIWVHRKIEMNEKSIKFASVSVFKRKHEDRVVPIPGIMAAEEEVILNLSFTEEGSKQLEALTSQNINRRLAIVLDGKLISAPLIRSPIPEGRVRISGVFTVEEAEAMAKRIRELVDNIKK